MDKGDFTSRQTFIVEVDSEDSPEETRLQVERAVRKKFSGAMVTLSNGYSEPEDDEGGGTPRPTPTIPPGPPDDRG